MLWAAARDAPDRQAAAEIKVSDFDRVFKNSCLTVAEDWPTPDRFKGLDGGS